MNFVSLGHNCSVQFTINKIKIDYVSIFSWCLSFDLKKIIELIDNDFKYLLDFKYWNKQKNIEYNLDYVHEPKLLNISEDEFNNLDFIKSLERKIERFRQLKNEDNSIYIRADINPSYIDIIKLYNALQLKNKKSCLIIICNNIIHYEDNNINNLIIIKKNDIFNKYKLKKGNNFFLRLKTDIINILKKKNIKI